MEGLRCVPSQWAPAPVHRRLRFGICLYLFRCSTWRRFSCSHHPASSSMAVHLTSWLLNDNDMKKESATALHMGWEFRCTFGRVVLLLYCKLHVLGLWVSGRSHLHDEHLHSRHRHRHKGVLTTRFIHGTDGGGGCVRADMDAQAAQRQDNISA